MRQGFPVTIAELVTAGRAPLPPEAAAIVLEVCSSVVSGPRRVVAAPITAASVFLDADGTVSVAGGPVVEDDQTVSLLGHLLLDMLRPGQPSSHRPAARLEALGLRAAATSDVSGLTLAKFVSEVRRFAPQDTGAAIRGLFERWRHGERPASTGSDQVPDTIRRLLPEADLAAMAGLTPTLHGDGVKAGFLHVGRKLLLTAGTLLLLSLAGATYLLRDGDGKEPGPVPATASQPSASRELLPGGTPAARPIAQPGTDPAKEPRPGARRPPADPD